MTTHHLTQLNHRLHQLMTETQLFTRPNVSRRQVASLIYTNEMYLHQTIRHYYGCAFSHYIGRLRMQKAVSMLLDPAYRHLSLTDIALDAGFGSRWTFYRRFKEMFGVTPEEWREAKLR